MQFRANALARREQGAVTGEAYRSAPGSSWTAVAILAIVVALIAVWSFVGRVTTSTSAQGFLTQIRGSVGVESPSDGLLTALTVKEGDFVQKGEGVGKVVVPGQGSLDLKSYVTGRVVSIAANEGQHVSVGEVVMVIERIGEPGDRVVAVLVLTGADLPAIRRGAEVTIQSAEPARSASVSWRGRVTEIGTDVQSQRQIAQFLGSDDVAQDLSRLGPGFEVIVDLGDSAEKKGGPGAIIGAWIELGTMTRTAVVGKIEGPAERPVDWIVP